MEFTINLGGCSVKGYEEWLTTHNNISPLVERLGINRVEKINNGKVEYYLEGDFNTNQGIKFDRDNIF